MRSGYRSARITLRLDGKVPAQWKERGHQVVEAGARSVDLRLLPATDDSGTGGSALTIAGNSLVLEIIEYNAGSERPFTRDAIQEVSAELSAVRRDVEEVERMGYLRKCLPEGSVRESAAELPLEVHEGLTRGTYRVSGFMNPQEKGYITLRTFDVPSGKELDSEVNSWRTARYVGWSGRREEKFFFECELEAPGLPADERVEQGTADAHRPDSRPAEQTIRVEVWFHGNQDRKFLETTTTLVPWER